MALRPSIARCKARGRSQKLERHLRNVCRRQLVAPPWRENGSVWWGRLDDQSECQLLPNGMAASWGSWRTSKILGCPGTGEM